jgi:hypothetical protein
MDSEEPLDLHRDIGGQKNRMKENSVSASKEKECFS